MIVEPPWQLPLREAGRELAFAFQLASESGRKAFLFRQSGRQSTLVAFAFLMPLRLLVFRSITTSRIFSFSFIL